MRYWSRIFLYALFLDGPHIEYKNRNDFGLVISKYENFPTIFCFVSKLQFRQRALLKLSLSLNILFSVYL
jgi:hypothetical protein